MGSYNIGPFIDFTRQHRKPLMEFVDEALKNALDLHMQAISDEIFFGTRNRQVYVNPEGNPLNIKVHKAVPKDEFWVWNTADRRFDKYMLQKEGQQMEKGS